jgi:hypothetical protein
MKILLLLLLIYTLCISNETKITISEINNIGGIKLVYNKKNRECRFVVSKDFGMNNKKQVDFLLKLNKYHNYSFKKCYDYFFDIPFNTYGIELFSDGTIDLLNRNGIMSNAFPAEQLFYLSMKQDDYAAKQFFLNRESLYKNAPHCYNMSAYLVQLYLYYNNVGELLNILSDKELAKLAKEFVYDMSGYDPCVKPNDLPLIKGIKKIKNKPNTLKFINFIEKAYFKLCKHSIDYSSCPTQPYKLK